jgi:hypothetical protein
VRKKSKAVLFTHEDVSVRTKLSNGAKIPRSGSAKKDEVTLEVSELFSFFTADIIKQNTLFTR